MMRLSLLIISLLCVTTLANSQESAKVFDTALFNKQLAFAEWLTEYEYFTSVAARPFINQPENTTTIWFSYKKYNKWFVIGGKSDGKTFNISQHFELDTLYTVTASNSSFDTSDIIAKGTALINAENRFQNVRDTSSIYFAPFVFTHPDQTISVWYFPSFQPSGQAIYGCEWEYVYDKTGKQLIRLDSYVHNVKAIWIGQPREIWLNYRSTTKPTQGSLFFAASFRDYFTRLRIDTLDGTSTLEKDNSGKYTWTQKMK